MNQVEVDEIQKLPNKYRPISPWLYFGLTILYTIPIVGLVFLIIHAISNENINRRNFARSYFCVLVILAIIVAVMVTLGVVMGSAFESYGGA